MLVKYYPPLPRRSSENPRRERTERRRGVKKTVKVECRPELFTLLPCSYCRTSPWLEPFPPPLPVTKSLTETETKRKTIQRCMSFTEKIVVGKFSGKVMHSGKVMLDCT